jgi:FtsP/CotA-like multicopper oxidase with cupredoxin domain
LQYGDGLYGPIVIHGPSSANWDTDIGTVFVNDWWHESAFVEYHTEQVDGPSAAGAPTGLVNGLNKYDGAGAYFNMSFTKGDTHRIRLINSAVDTHFKVMIDDHNMTVMAADFVPIRPYATQVLSIGIGTSMMSSNLGQRYDIVVDASQDVGNYWFRAIPQTSCSTNENTDGIIANVRYVGAEEEDATTSAYTYTDSCSDENSTNLIPILEISPTTFISGQTLDVAIAPENGLFYWSVNSSSLYLNWYEWLHLIDKGRTRHC